MSVKLFRRKRLWIILTSVFAVFLIAMIVGTTIAVKYGSAAINMIFGISTTKTVGTTEKMRFESDWANPNGEGLFIENKIMTRKAAAEGMVLLWNNGIADGSDALPVAEGSKLSFFSHSSVDIVESGTGSGHIDTVTQTGRDASTSLKSAMSRYFEVNDKLWNFYDIGEGSGYSRGKTNYSESGPGNINEVPWSVYTDDVKKSFADYSDAAVIIVSRTGGENGDLHTSNENSQSDGGYLTLTQEEKDLLSNVTGNDTFKRVILVLNTGNPVMMRDFEPYMDGIDAAI